MKAAFSVDRGDGIRDCIEQSSEPAVLPADLIRPREHRLAGPGGEPAREDSHLSRRGVELASLDEVEDAIAEQPVLAHHRGGVETERAGPRAQRPERVLAEQERHCRLDVSSPQRCAQVFEQPWQHLA